MRRLLVLVLCAVAWPQSALHAQQEPVARDCEIVDGEDLQVVGRGSPRERVILRGNAHIRCAGGVELRADTAVSHTLTGHREFIGHVFYEDTVKSLTADRVDYEHEQARLVAVGNVVLTDIKAGSVVTGTELEYYRATEERPEPRTVVRGRPHATLYESPETQDDAATPIPVAAPPADSAAEPFEIDADEMEIFGEQHFRATGRVEIVRGSTTGFGDAAEFDQVAQRLILEGDAIVEGEAFSLAGDWIRAFLDGDDLREVLARQDAVLLSEDLRIDAPELQVFFQEGEVHRLVAVRMLADSSEVDEPAPMAEEGAIVATADSLGNAAEAMAPGDDEIVVLAGDSTATVIDSVLVAADSAEVAPPPPPSRRTVGPQPRATASDFWIMADSIDAIAPGQQLERVIAVGNAYGERTADSLDVKVPELIARDWLRGDTITGYFATVPVADSASTSDTDDERPRAKAALSTDAAPTTDIAPVDDGDSVADGEAAETRTTLERLVAVGPEGRAQSLYRIREDGEEATPSVNFLIANQITLLLRDGEVTNVEALGPIKGVHLQPEGATDAEAPDATEPSAEAVESATGGS